MPRKLAIGARVGLAVIVLGLAIGSQAPTIYAAFCALRASLQTYATTPATLPSPVSIDYIEGSDQLVVSVNNTTAGVPGNLDAIPVATGVASAFPATALAGLPGDVPVASVRSGVCQGGFGAGDVFAASGAAIYRVPFGGLAAAALVAALPGENGAITGLYQDHACVMGGDLIAITSTGNVWRVTAAGVAAAVRGPGGAAAPSLNTPLKAVATIPNDAVKYGPAAGRILVGDSAGSRLFAIDATGDIVTIGAQYNGNPNFYVPVSAQNASQTVTVNTTDLDVLRQRNVLVPGDGDVYGVDAATGQIIRVPEPFVGGACLDQCGAILVTEGTPTFSPTGLSELYWDAPSGSFVVNKINNIGSVTPQQWTSVTQRGGTDCRTCAGTIGDRIWKDLNGNGLQDGLEPGIPGVKVTLTMPGVPQFSVSTTTDANGNYKFSGLCAGTYTVTAATPAGDTPTQTTAGLDLTADSNANPASVLLLTDSSNDPTVDFGFKGPGTIGDLIWNDGAACNGVQGDAGELGLSNVLVHLFFRNPVTNAWVEVAQTTSNVSGAYHFQNLNPGDYRVVADTPAGFTQAPTGQGTSTTDSNLTPAGLTLTLGQPTDNSIDFGFCPPAPNVAIVKKTNGADANDSNAAGVPNLAPGAAVTWTYEVTNTGSVSVPLVQVSVTDNTPGVTPAPVVVMGVVAGDTNSNNVLDPGETWIYSASGVALNLLLPPPPGVTTVTNSCTAGGTQPARTAYTNVGTVTVPGASATNPSSYCNPVPSSLGDFVWVDTNANGLQDTGETSGVVGATAQLYACAAGVPSAPTTDAIQTIGANGAYGFSNLTPGTYAVKFTLPAGYAASPANQGASDAVDSDSVGGFSQCVTLASGENNPTVDAGAYQKASLGDFVWVDTNANGLQDTGETSGVVGATAQLYACAAGVPSAPTTDAIQTIGANGAYGFSNLTPGTYAVKFTLPAGYAASPANQGASDAVDSDSVGGFSQCVTLASGQNNPTVDAGAYRPASLGDFVWNDVNANGQQDSESGIPNVTVTLRDCSGNPVSDISGNAVPNQLTTASGAYLFTNLMPGCYKVLFTTPAGYLLSPANAGADATDSDNVAGTTGNYTLGSGQTDLTVDAGFYKPAQLSVVKTPDNGTFTQGSQVSFTIAVKNPAAAGSASATNVALNDTLPTAGGMTWASATSTQGTCTITSGSALSCSLGTIAAQATVTVTVSSPATTPLNACQLQSNPAANATADGGLSATDSGSLTCIKPAPAQLSVVKTPDNGVFAQGGQASFTIVVTNPAPSGASSATNVMLNDALPTAGGMSWATATTTQGTCTITSGSALSCALGTIAPQATVTVTVTSPAATPSAACQVQNNPAANVTGDGGLTGSDSGSLTCVPAAASLICGDTATIGYWHNGNGQYLIQNMNGSTSSTLLANWLASNFPYLYGANAGANNLTGKKNTDVAALFLTFFNGASPKVDAQVMAGALALYATDWDLSGGAAIVQGFNSSPGGTAVKTYNVGTYGTALGLTNNTLYTVQQLMQQANLRKQQGTFNATAFAAIFDGINTAGDIANCQHGKSFTVSGSMEGNLSNIRPGDWVNGGYSFSFVNATHVATDFTVTGTVYIPVQCSQGGGTGGDIVIPLNQLPFGNAVPAVPLTGTPTGFGMKWSVPANLTGWLASGDQNNVWVWSGAVQAPNLCNGYPMDDMGQAYFTPTVSQSPATGSLVDFRFHYRDPAAKGKANTNCLNTSDPNRAVADICGASWSGTKRDP